MKIIAHLPGKNDKEDAAIIEMSVSEFEKIMGLEGRTHNTRLKSLVNKTVQLPNMFSELSYLSTNRKKLQMAAVVMKDMAKQLETLLPEVE